MEGYINGYRVVYDNPYDLSDKRYLGETFHQVRKCLMALPPDISLEDFLKGMMVLTRGRINPSIVKEVWEEHQQVRVDLLIGVLYCIRSRMAI